MARCSGMASSAVWHQRVAATSSRTCWVASSINAAGFPASGRAGGPIVFQTDQSTNRRWPRGLRHSSLVVQLGLRALVSMCGPGTGCCSSHGQGVGVLERYKAERRMWRLPKGRQDTGPGVMMQTRCVRRCCRGLLGAASRVGRCAGRALADDGRVALQERGQERVWDPKTRQGQQHRGRWKGCNEKRVCWGEVVEMAG